MGQADERGNQNAANLPYIQTNFARPLTVFVPTLYRFLPKEFVEKFFTSGSLMLSCVSQFKKHKDENQGDPHEGSAMVGINDLVANRSIFTYKINLSNAYILSFTTKTGDIAASFGDSSFEVFEPLGFSAEIANEIPGCQHAMMGSCIYVDERILISDQTAPTLEDLESDAEPGNIDLNKLMQAASGFSGPKEYFLKHRKYEAQMEFRMIWETNKPVNAPLIITLQKPERFCRQVAPKITPSKA